MEDVVINPSTPPSISADPTINHTTEHFLLVVIVVKSDFHIKPAPANTQTTTPTSVSTRNVVCLGTAPRRVEQDLDVSASSSLGQEPRPRNGRWRVGRKIASHKPSPLPPPPRYDADYDDDDGDYGDEIIFRTSTMTYATADPDNFPASSLLSQRNRLNKPCLAKATQCWI